MAIVNGIDANDAVEILMQQKIKEFASLIPSDGVGVWGAWTYLGSVLGAEEIPALLVAAQRSGNSYDIWETHRLGLHLNETEIIGRTVAGALLIPITIRPATYLIYFRSEHAHEVEWPAIRQSRRQMGLNLRILTRARVSRRGRKTFVAARCP